MATAAGPASPARQRILETGYRLFTRRRVSDVGINEVIAQARVTKATFYNHFASKDALVIEVLALREQRATFEWLERGARERGATPEERLLVVFDLLEEWFAGDEFSGCPFINVLLEFGPDHANGRASIAHLDTVRGVVLGLAQEAGLRDPRSFAGAFGLLMRGAIVAAAERDPRAAGTAKEMARGLIARHRV